MNNKPQAQGKSVDEMAKEYTEIVLEKVNSKSVKEEISEAFKAGFLAASPKGKEEDGCSHEPLTDTGVGYYHCPACGKGWTYDEWEKLIPKDTSGMQKEYEVYKEERGMLHGWYRSSPVEYESYPEDKRRIIESAPLLSTQQGERRFTLAEALNIWQTATNFTYNEDYGKIPNTVPNIKEYFKEKFNIDI